MTAKRKPAFARATKAPKAKKPPEVLARIASPVVSYTHARMYIAVGDAWVECSRDTLHGALQAHHSELPLRKSSGTLWSVADMLLAYGEFSGGTPTKGGPA